MRQRFTEEMKQAMKEGDKRKLATVRLIMAALKDKDIEARGAGKGPVSDDDVLALLQKMIKQRLESAEIYGQAGRTELAEQEKEEVAIIRTFMPAQMDEEAVKAAIAEAIVETGATGIKEMGKVVGVLKGKYAGQMDFAKASAAVKKALSA